MGTPMASTEPAGTTTDPAGPVPGPRPAPVIPGGDLRAAVVAAHAALRGGQSLEFPSPAPSAGRIERAHHSAVVGLGRSLRVEAPDRVSAPRRARRGSPAPGPRRVLQGTAIVTGAGAGIGRALALALAAEGMQVLGVDRDAEAARSVEAEATGDLRCHIGDLCTMDALPGQGPIDLLVHNAGISCVGRFAQQELPDLLAVTALNFEAPLRLTEAALADGRLGSVVFVSSLSHQVGYPGAAVYAATKDGLVGYADALRSERSADNTQVLTVFPGPTRTEHARRYAPQGASEDRRMPPEEVAAAIVIALQRGEAELIPGGGNRALAWLGTRSPRLGEWLMERAILRKLDAASP